MKSERFFVTDFGRQIEECSSLVEARRRVKWHEENSLPGLNYLFEVEHVVLDQMEMFDETTDVCPVRQ